MQPTHHLRALVRTGVRAVKLLDRPGGRSLLAGLASLRLMVKFRKPMALHRENGTWVYRWRGARIPHPTFGSALHPEEARDIFTFEYSPRPGDVVLDVGAGVGDSSLFFSRLVGDQGRVVAVEAHPDAHRWLVQLCELNRLTNVLPLQLAASDVDGEVTMSDDGSLTNRILPAKGNGGIRVPARRLDGLVHQLAISHIDFLKMNIEGAERQALPGMSETLARTSRVCISCHDFIADRGGPPEMRTKAFVSGFLVAHGFHVSSRSRGRDNVRSYVYGTKVDAGSCIEGA